jgi:hypothetical protein
VQLESPVIPGTFAVAFVTEPCALVGRSFGDEIRGERLLEVLLLSRGSLTSIVWI